MIPHCTRMKVGALNMFAPLHFYYHHFASLPAKYSERNTDWSLIVSPVKCIHMTTITHHCSGIQLSKVVKLCLTHKYMFVDYAMRIINFALSEPCMYVHIYTTTCV